VHPKTKTRLTLLTLWLALYCTFALFLPPLLDDADSVHAEVAREMLLRHDYVTLYANGIRYLEKAPILYWSIAASFKLFGTSTAATRLPLSLTVLALTLLLEAFARRAFASPRAGLYAGLITLSSFGIFIFTRIAIPDAQLCLWLTLALYAFYQTENPATTPGAPRLASVTWVPTKSNTTRPPAYLFATACALNVLTKGLIGIVFPTAIVLIYLLLTRGPAGAIKRLHQLHPIPSTLLFLAIAAPWHILIALANPTQGHPGALTFTNHHWHVPLPTDGNVHGWLWFYFVNEQVLRYLNLRVPHDYDTVPLWLFYALILAWLLPWSPYLFPALTRPRAANPGAPSSSRSHRDRVGFTTNLEGSTQNRTHLLLILSALIPLLFFSLSTRQEYYVLPALPALILLTANYLATNTPETLRTKTRISALLAILGIIAATISLYFTLRAKTPPPQTDVSTLLTQNPADYALSFGHILDLSTRALGMFRPSLILVTIAFGIGLPAAWYLFRRSQPHAAILTTTASAAVFLLAAHLALQGFTPVLSSEPLARAIAPQLQANDLIVIHGEYESASTLGFYLSRNDLHILEGRSSNLWYGSFFPDAPKIFETPETITQKWSQPQRIFLWQDPTDQTRPPLPLTPTYLIAQSGGKQILSNQPNH
jgi:4-amino-4-deoxy-L-arabinose transferase-like glycosyltransferase